MPSSSAPILIVGAGPAGLVLALTLLRNGIPVRVIDKEQTHRGGLRGSGIFPRSLELFHFLGVDEIQKNGYPVKPVYLYKPGNLQPVKETFLAGHREPTPSIPFYNPIIMSQEFTEHHLRSHVEKFGCKVEYGTTFHSFEQFPDRVIVHVAKQRDGHEISETIETPWLLGTDGGKGSIRKQLGLTFLGETREQTNMALIDIRVYNTQLDRFHWHVFGDATSKLVNMRPIEEHGPDAWNFIIGGPDVDVPKVLSDRDELIKCICSVIPEQLAFGETLWTSDFRANIRMVNKFGEGRVYIAGDAAHVHSPTGGQGLNSSVQDAFNLGWKLALVQKDLSPPSLLDTYTTERLPVIAEMLRETTAILEKRAAATAESRESGFERSQKLLMLGVNYRTSPIVVDELAVQVESWNAYGALEEGSLQAGDRAPDAPALEVIKSYGDLACGSLTRLFDIFRPYHHVALIFTNDASSAAPHLAALKRFPEGTLRSVVLLPSGASLSDLQSSPADLILSDRDGYAYGAYLVDEGESRVVIVRPDGVISAIVLGAEAITKYVSLVFKV